MAASTVIIDTDPGVDDIHALLLALAASPDDLTVPLISVTWGNVGAKSCLRNVVSLFHVIQKELEYRKEKDLPAGFECLKACKPTVAIGADGPLDGSAKSADYFHGVDGLAGIYETHPHLTPEDAWEELFEAPPSSATIAAKAESVTHSVPPQPTESKDLLFTPTHTPSHIAILDLLRSHPLDTIDIIALGPLTTIALAAATDPVAFLRVKSLIIMGGAISVPGNITPLGEFNFYADPLAAARVLALTSPNPASTMPPLSGASSSSSRNEELLGLYPAPSALGPRRLQTVLFPLDITEQHPIPRTTYHSTTDPLMVAGSPLAAFGAYLFGKTFDKLESLTHGITGFTLHDPLCVWWAMERGRMGESSGWKLGAEQDVRVESGGQWTRGACIVDRRLRKEMADEDGDVKGVEGNELNEEAEEEEVIGDAGGWLNKMRGNRVRSCVATPGWESFAKTMLDSVYRGI